MSESLLHQQLKRLYAQDEAATEQVVSGYRIDAVDGQGRLVEIQTASFGAIAPKLRRLLKRHTVLLVHPVCTRRWIVLHDGDGNPGRRRASPLKGRWEEVFAELVALPDLLDHPNLRIEVLLTEEEECRAVRAARRRQKPYTVLERRLVGVLDKVELDGLDDWLRVLPPALERWFTSRGLSQRLECSEGLARCITYCLREAGCLRTCGKLGNRVVYARTPDPADPTPAERRRIDLRELKRCDFGAWKRALRTVYGPAAELHLADAEALEELGHLLHTSPGRLQILLEEERRRADSTS